VGLCRGRLADDGGLAGPFAGKPAPTVGRESGLGFVGVGGRSCTKELENSALRAIVGKQAGTKNSRQTGKISREQQ